MVANFLKKQKGDKKNNLVFRSLGIFVLLLAIFFAVADFRIYQKKQELKQRIGYLQQQIKDSQDRGQKLQEEIANADNPDYIEKVAREQENMQKPGEKVVSFVMPDQKASAKNRKPKTFWQSVAEWPSNFWAWLKSKF